MHTKYYIILFLGLTLFSCEKEILQQSESENQIVVEAYLYSGEVIDDVNITEMLPYDGEDTVYTSISDAEITLYHNYMAYPLMSSDSAGWYHYPGDDLEIIVGDSYTLQFDYSGKQISSETIVPEAPTGLTISQTEVYINEDDYQDNPFAFMESIPQIELNWDESEGDYFFVLVENIEEDPVDIDLGIISERMENFRFVSRPVPLNSYILMPMLIIQQYGTHLIRVFRVNQEYADLYESMEQDSRNLNEPLTNIENGLGVFTAFSCDSIYLEVIND
jgi:hypothetical protein